MTANTARSVLAAVFDGHGLTARSYDPPVLEYMTGLPSTRRVPPLEPDILGEHFVLSRFSPDDPLAHEAMALVDRAWRCNPLGTCATPDRMTDDFLTHPALARLLLHVPQNHGADTQCLSAAHGDQAGG